jgi:hypothetical protein
MDCGKFLQDGLRRGFDVGFIGHVATDSQRLDAFICGRRSGGLGSFRINVDAGDIGFGLREGKRDGPTDTVAGTGDHG